jgi:ABC-type lipoprotein export system ATPase subunit
MNILSVENVTISFGKRNILNNLSLQVEDNSIIAITGKSGSGKTTLFGVMSGLLKPENGTVKFIDSDIYKWNDFRRSRYRNREIGYVFQTFNLLPDLDGYRNIIFPAVLNRFSRGIKSKVEYLIQYLDLKDIIGQYPSTLSGGEKQRVSIARAIINSPRLILADEPTGNLDRENGKRIFDLFKEIKKERRISVVIATHDNSIIKNCDSHYHLEEGRITRKK